MAERETGPIVRNAPVYVTRLAAHPDRIVRGRAYNPYDSSVLNAYDVTEPRTWMCLICGWIYDESVGDPEHGLAPGTPWEAVPMNWTCPECGARKEDFEMVRI